MYEYYTRKFTHSEQRCLPRKRRFSAARTTIYPPQESSAVRTTDSLPSSPLVSQGADFPKVNGLRAASSLPPRYKVTRSTRPLLPGGSAIGRDVPPLMQMGIP